jgi:K+-sensing histidine kinase KdpD
MLYLVEVNRSQPALEALRAAAESARREPNAELVLVHVSRSARAAEIESGRRLLEECRNQCRVLAGEVVVRTCLEVGERLERLACTADQVAADCVVVGAHDAGEFPRLGEIGASAQAAVARLTRPVMVVGRSGIRRFDTCLEENDGPCA